jgi:hypothetical protein
MTISLLKEEIAASGGPVCGKFGCQPQTRRGEEGRGGNMDLLKLAMPFGNVDLHELAVVNCQLDRTKGDTFERFSNGCKDLCLIKQTPGLTCVRRQCGETGHVDSCVCLCRPTYLNCLSWQSQLGAPKQQLGGGDPKVGEDNGQKLQTHLK